MDTAVGNGAEASADTERAGTRRALLIGVRDTPNLARNPRLTDRYPSLECVDGDIRRIAEALDASDYRVECYHPDHEDEEHHDTSRDMIKQAIMDLFDSCSPGDTALVYVSSHGVMIGDSDYVLPSSARSSAAGELITGTLLEATVPDLLGEVPEGVTVVVCLDTCRTDTTGRPSKGNNPYVGNAHDDVVWLRAGGRGQPTFADPERGSYFGLALSEALSSIHFPRSLGEIKDFVQARIHVLTRTLDGPRPTVELKAAAGREDWARELLLCEGSRETTHWKDVIDGSVLWRHTSGTAAAHERVKEGLVELAAEVARGRVLTKSALDTPWHDPDYPERVVRLLGQLVERAGLRGTERLSPAETAALLAAPLLHEGVVAVALGELAALRPDRLDRLEKDDQGTKLATRHEELVCKAAADTCWAHPQVLQTAGTLWRRKPTDAAIAADHWLRHRFIADWDRLWDRTDDYGSVNKLLDMVVEAVSAAAEGMPAPQPSEVDQHVRRVLPHMTVAPGSTPRIDASSSPGWSRAHRPVPGNDWRARELAYLLWLAALLAADPRRMSGVLVDHLGARRPLLPADVVTALAGVGWEVIDRDGKTGYALRLACPHPALHAALEELATTADASVRDLHREWHDSGQPAPYLLRGVPHQVTTQHLEPADPSYTVPLERFRLAEDEIRPLLMGTQLYGDRMLAVRELYQNALDACRHRKQRAAYGAKRELFDGPEPKPEIHFVQAYDGDRPYIECRDEGSGMSRSKLTSMFARAGRRYAQDPDHVQERRNWRRVGMEPAPFNSRFGIGVFSYFMLADEVTVHTGEIDQHGNPSRSAAPLRATVQSGSGLLQIRETGSGPVHGGTVVRLYLSSEEDEGDRPSVVKTLRRLLWVSEFEVTAEERGRDGEMIDSEVWKPGVLLAPSTRAGQWHGTPVRAGDNGWIVQGEGQLLLDGILVEDAPKVQGYVFNLQARHRPEPSVNRNSLISYDEEGVEEELLTVAPAAARKLDEVKLPWLWSLARAEPRLTVRLFDHLPPYATGVLDPELVGFQPHSSRAPLHRAGVFEMDSTLLQSFSHEASTSRTRNKDEFLKKWRLEAMGAVPQTAPLPPRGYPVPMGMDALLVSNRLFDRGWAASIRVAALTKVPLAESVRAARRYAIAGAYVPAVQNLVNLRAVGVPTALMVDLCEAHENSGTKVRPTGRPAAYFPLLSVAAGHDVPPSHLLPALEVLLSLGIDFPEMIALASPSLKTRPPTGAADFLGSYIDFPYEWREEVHPNDLLACTNTPAQRRQLFQWINSLEQIGLSHNDAVREETIDHIAFTSLERKLMSRDLDGEPPWLPAGRLTSLQLMERSAELSRPLGEVARTVARLAPVTGVTPPNVPTECHAWIPSPWIAQAMHIRKSLAADAEDIQSNWQLLFLAYRHSPRPSSDELRKGLSFMEACGTLNGSVDTLVEQFEALTPSFVDLLNYKTEQIETLWLPDTGEVSIPMLLRIAAKRHSSLGEVFDDVAQTKALFSIRLPHLPEQARTLTPVYGEVNSLLRRVGDREVLRERLDIRSVLVLAQKRRCTLGQTARFLGSYQCLGGPQGPGPVTDALEGFRPTDLDLAAFEPSLLGSGILGPLELVLVAGRFGHTLGEAHDRYAPFEDLGLTVTVPAPEGAEREIVPDWRDVIVLTEHLTGRAPAISGTITDEHIVLCAEETEESEDDVRGRLRRYSRLFSLVVPIPGGARS
ncbi:caspase family protein [Streptomyces sp. WAC08241]|uniref:HD domain-containing protein n=1 Tax=Streptomyces sp. WAC08241 TaxID=2487421 RepID=UPI00163C3D84|nr:caspase family protein [Streptomyces sp. WAC08241]